jgi:hypothetical protein
MAYARKQDFVPDFQAAEALAGQKYGAFYKKVDDDVAWKAYSNAAEKTDAGKSVLGLMLFGRHVASMKQEIAKKAQADFNARQTAISAKDARLESRWYVSRFYRQNKIQKLTTANFARLEAEKKNIPAAIDTDEDGAMIQNFGVVNNSDNGSILLMGSALWNLTINDCWVLGAVHSHLPFYPASKVSKANIFDEKYILSITGRELFGLALFGYRQVISPHAETLGSAFEVQDPRKASGATLLAYQQAMGSLTKGAAETAFKDAGFLIAEVGY